jgi:hypothetical protein
MEQVFTHAYTLDIFFPQNVIQNKFSSTVDGDGKTQGYAQ